MEYVRNGETVTLTMAVGDYELLLLFLGLTAGWSEKNDESIHRAVIIFINEMNRTNREFSPVGPTGKPIEGVPN